MTHGQSGFAGGGEEKAVEAKVAEARGVGEGFVRAEGNFGVENAKGMFPDFKGRAFLIGSASEADEFGDREDRVALLEGLGAVGVACAVGKDDSIGSGTERGGFGSEFDEDLADGLGGGGIEAGDAKTRAFAEKGGG